MGTESLLVRARAIVNRLRSAADHDPLIDELSTLIDQLHAMTAGDAARADGNEAASLSLDIATGCYRQAGGEGYFCPDCFDRRGLRVATRRLNSRLRVCPACRLSIRPKG